jgi:pilus assembly protein CpaE
MRQPITFVTLCAERREAEGLRAALEEGGRARVLASCATVEELSAAASQARPSAVLVVLGADAEAGAKLVRRACEALPTAAVVAAARMASPALVMSALRAGAHEFLQLPPGAAELQTVLERTSSLCAARQASEGGKGRVLAVFSSKGGVGVSFIAANLAAAMPGPTLLVDLNLQSGDGDSLLGVKPAYTLTDAVRNLARLDEALLGSYVARHSPRLALLAAPAEPHEAEEVKPEHIAELLRVLRACYPFVVLDLKDSFDALTIAALDQADDLLLVLTLDVPGIRSARRALKVFERLGYPRAKTHVVVNRWSKHVDVELEKVEAHLGERLLGLVPSDYRRVIDSINLGRPLVLSDPGSKVSEALREIAAALSGGAGAAPAERHGGLLHSLWRRREPSPAPLELRAAHGRA